MNIIKMCNEGLEFVQAENAKQVKSASYANGLRVDDK